MKFLKQIVGFLFILSILLSGKAFFGESVFAAGNSYDGIPILGEEKMPIKTDIKDIVNKMDGDSEDEGIRILSATAYYLIDLVKELLYGIALFIILLA